MRVRAEIVDGSLLPIRELLATDQGVAVSVRFCDNTTIRFKRTAWEISMTTEESSVELELKLKLPGSLVREAKARGLLTPEGLEVLLREEVQRRRVTQLFEAADRLAGLSPLTEAEVEAEIQAARAERRASRSSSR